MSCPSSIYTVNTNFEAAADGILPFGTTVRRYGRNCNLSGAGIEMTGAGYFDVEASLTYTPTATGPVTLTLLRDGLPIRGAVATTQGTAAEPLNLFVITKVLNCGCCCSSTLTATISAAGVANNFATDVDKD